MADALKKLDDAVLLGAVRDLLLAAGDDPAREGLQDTPHRVQRAYQEWFSGYRRDPQSVFRAFEDGAANCDELVLVSNNEIFSHCEHHMVPFFGLAHVGYIPNGRILGLSKFARLVDIFSRRLQVQERLTNQIADALWEGLRPKGLGVVLECRHLCMETRGVRARRAITSTSALRGALKQDGNSRSEFFSLVLAASKVREGL